MKLILILNLLTQSWNHSFGLFVIIKTTWFILDSSSWSLLLQNRIKSISPYVRFSYSSIPIFEKSITSHFFVDSYEICQNRKVCKYIFEIGLTNHQKITAQRELTILPKHVSAEKNRVPYTCFLLLKLVS